MSHKKHEMSIYNQNDEFVNYNVEFINGYLTSIALLRDYTTNEVGFNFYFKKIGDDKSVNEAINDEVKWSLERYIGIEEVNKLNSVSSRIIELDNWEVDLLLLLNFWIGNGLTNAIKEESRKWKNSQDLVLQDLIEHLKFFFHDKEMRVFVFNKEFKSELPIQWGWLKFDDILFTDSVETVGSP